MSKAHRTPCLVFGAFVFVALVAPPSASRAADPWDPIWERTVDPDTGGLVVAPLTAAATDRSGHVYVTGVVGTPDGWSAMTLTRYGPQGGLRWRRTWRAMSGFHRHTAGFDVAVAPDGRTVYVGGAQFNDSTEEGIPRVWAYRASGSLRWTRVAWSGAASAMVRAVAARTSGVVVGGERFGECGPTNGIVAALGRGGDRLWQDRFEPAARASYGDALYGLTLDGRGRIYAVGSQDQGATSCDLTEPTPDVDVVVQQRSATGEIVWTRVWASERGVDDDVALTVATRDGRVFVGGRRDGFPGRAWLARIAPTGTVLWYRTFGPEPPAGAQLTGLSVAPWGPVYAVGKAKGAMFLRRYSPMGEVRSDRRLGGPAASDVATAWVDAVYVTGRATLWRMPR